MRATLAAPLRLADGHGRVARDLRVSLTDRCTLRCVYCMPAEGLPWLPAKDVLTDAEVVRLVTIAVERLGVRTVRLTGGEPLLRRGLEGIVASIAALRLDDGTAPRVSLTTNGLGLRHRAAALAAAGLERVNVSLDTLDRARYAAITRRDRLPDVLTGLAAARDAGLTPVKVNTVLMRGTNDDEIATLLRWALDEGYHLRFIEQMPLGPADAWDPATRVTADEILATLRHTCRLTPTDPELRGAAPASVWTVDDGPGTVGVIASVSNPFCGACDRVRLTSDGQVRDCLFARRETDLRALLRGGADDAELAQAWAGAMLGKAAAHGGDGTDLRPPARLMSSIGG